MNRRRKKRLLAAALLAAAVFLLMGERKGEYIGEFDLSHYCIEVWDGDHICGNSDRGCEGDRLVPGKSLAVPASVLEKYPVGTRVLLQYPDGKKEKLTIHDTGRILDDLGRLDKPVKTHSEAMRLGVVKNVKLYKLK